jgi:pimeloyl-ACP methyl ester carboxylesterase
VKEASMTTFVLGPAGARCLVFLPGFMVRPSAYRSLLAPVAAAGTQVIVPSLYRRGLRALAGRISPEDEAGRALEIGRQVLAAGAELWLGGHSRGGFAAWLAAASTSSATDGGQVVGLVCVDPVAGGGGPWASAEPPPGLTPGLPVLVIGCGIGGRCAPQGRNHVVFAGAAPGCSHVVVPDCGHADMLDGRTGRLGSSLCGHGSDRDRGRAAISTLIVRFMSSGRPTASGAH